MLINVSPQCEKVYDIYEKVNFFILRKPGFIIFQCDWKSELPNSVWPIFFYIEF
jgi:hypothetical protein